MKTIILILFSICMFTHSNAQTNSLNPKQELLNLLKSKHGWERISFYNKKNALPLETIYQESYAKIQENKIKIIAYIDNALKVDAPALSKEFIFYHYESPASSVIDFRNRMSLLTYYKIIKYSLDSSRIAPPYLSDIPFITDSNAQTKCLDPKQELLNLLISKHYYEMLMTLNNKENALIPFKTKYQESYAMIQRNKHKIIAYIDNALKVDAQALSNECVLYEFKSPVSPESESLMSLFTYYKIIKYSLETSRISLPQLSEIPSLY